MTTAMGNRNFYNETSSDEFSSDSSSSGGDDGNSSEDEGERTVKLPYKSPRKCAIKRRRCEDDIGGCDGSEDRNQNIFMKLFNRESSGYFHNKLNGKSHQQAFRKVPSRLSFCLKDIVPYCYLQGHMFMGLTVCGQFLISYKVCYDENSLVSEYNFSTHYKYTLYFWIYRPHQPLGKYYKICLFDDHGVDNLKTVTMTQWLSNPRVLVVHGASEYENEDSYVTIVRVPKLGCLDCKELREIDADGYIRCDALCIKCNLTIHTKYSTTESDPCFNPHVNLICPERIVLVANGFVHMLHIELEVQKQLQQSPQHQSQSVNIHHQQIIAMTTKYSVPMQIITDTAPANNIAAAQSHLQINESKTVAVGESGQTDPAAKSSALPDPASTDTGCDNKNNIVARIIADFSDIENDVQTLNDKNHRWTDSKTLNYNELIFTCGSSSVANSNTSNSSGSSGKTANNARSQSKVTLLNHQGRRNHKIITKSYRNCVTTVDLQFGGGISSTDKSNAYEFSEDNENCEKIGTFRKRRLADKKYAFSEDNSENIIPFTKARLTTQSPRIHRTFGSSYHHSTHPATVVLSPSSSQSYETTSHLHRASPSQGFRSPCGSPVGSNRLLRSPPGRTIQKSPPQQQQQNVVKPLNALSPRHIVFPKRSNNEKDSFLSASPILSPRRDDHFLQLDSSEKPTCTKKFKRRYVEEDDAASVITSEEAEYLRRYSGSLGRGSSSYRAWYVSEASSLPTVIEYRVISGINQKQDAIHIFFQIFCLGKHILYQSLRFDLMEYRDDCISPGYHTSLPIEVHGSCYSDMQMISETSYQKLKCPTVIITQHSFDLDTFTYHVISNLCLKNNKTYDVFYDWACELVNVCPHSNSISCILMAHFTARDRLPNNSKKCINCSRNIDCVFHRKQFECRIFFTWNMETGIWDVLDYGQLLEVPSMNSNIRTNGGSLTKIAKNLANELMAELHPIQNFVSNLNVLDSNVDKSKDSLVDINNSIEFYRKRTKLFRSGMELNN